VSAVGFELLLAVRAEPLDVHQLCADLAASPTVVTGALEGLIEAGLVHGVTVKDGRQQWGLTVRGRWQVGGS
jgi:hypothetical protein